MDYYTATNNLCYRSNLYKVQTQRKQTRSTGLGQWFPGYHGVGGVFWKGSKGVFGIVVMLALDLGTV